MKEDYRREREYEKMYPINSLQNTSSQKAEKMQMNVLKRNYLTSERSMCE